MMIYKETGLGVCLCYSAIHASALVCVRAHSHFQDLSSCSADGLTGKTSANYADTPITCFNPGIIYYSLTAEILSYCMTRSLYVFPPRKSIETCKLDRYEC